MKKIVLLSFAMLYGAHLIAVPKATPEAIIEFAKAILDCGTPGNFDGAIADLQQRQAQSETARQEGDFWKFITLKAFPEAANFPTQKLDELITAYYIVNMPEIKADVEKYGIFSYYEPNNN